MKRSDRFFKELNSLHFTSIKRSEFEAETKRSKQKQNEVRIKVTGSLVPLCLVKMKSKSKRTGLKNLPQNRSLTASSILKPVQTL